MKKTSLKLFEKKYLQSYEILVTESLPYKKLLQTILSELEVRPEEKILDAGCGTGSFIKELTKKGAKVIAFDKSLSAIQICKTKFPNVPIYHLDITKPLPFLDREFDKIILNNVLYLISPNKREFVLQELYRVLKPKGKIAITNPKKGGKNLRIFIEDIKKSFQYRGFFGGLKRVSKVLKKALFMLPPYLKEVNPSFFLSKEEQEKLLQNKGFKIIKTIFVYANQAILTIAEK